MSCSQSMRILIMEDDAGQARLAQRTLGRAGYAVTVAGDGDTGLALCATEAYDVLMVDHQMPGIGGLEVLRTLAAQGALPPTIMVTGHGDEAMAVEAMKLGAGDYLVKDVDGRYLTLLPTVVARVLHQQRLLEEKRQAEEAREKTREELETRVRERTATLQQVNAQRHAEIAEREQAETAWAQLNRRHKLILDSAGEGIYGIDLEGRLTFVNPAAARLLGWEVEELLGQPPKELPREVRPFWRRVRSVLERVRNVLEGVAAVGEILVRGGVGCCGVLGTDLPLSPCDMGHRRAWETLEEDGRDRNGPGQLSYPCAGRATSVYPNALACLAIVVTLRARYCAS